MLNLILRLALILCHIDLSVLDVRKCEVEVYLVDSLTKRIVKGSLPDYRVGESDVPFFNDKEILGYEVVQRYAAYGQIESSYSLIVNKDARERLANLTVPVVSGRRFLLTVNGLAIFEGHFWNPVSSYSSNEITIQTTGWDMLCIQKGYPEKSFFYSFPAPLDNKLLLDAFRKTNRLMIKLVNN